MVEPTEAGIFPALLKFWRHHRGMSQLDLSLAADVSSRHVSFLETGRSKPSAEMVLTLAAALAVPLRQRNQLLQAAGHPARFPEPDGLSAALAGAIDLMKRHAEPYPLLVVDRLYNVVDLNGGARWMASVTFGDIDLAHGLNLARLTFSEVGATVLSNFAQVGRELLWRIHREALEDPGDRELVELLADLHTQPTVDPDWRHVDLGVSSEPVLTVELASTAGPLRFVTTVTSFQAPQNLVADELRIETWIPADEATAAACAAGSGAAGG